VERLGKVKNYFEQSLKLQDKSRPVLLALKMCLKLYWENGQL